MKTEPQMAFGRSVLAVETGPDWFKLVHGIRERSGVRIAKVIVRRTDEVEPLAGPNFLKALGIPDLEGVPTVVCLPRQAVNVRLFDLPSADPREIADMIDLQLARQTPYSREEIVFDYRLFPGEKAGYTRVMLVIAQTGLVRQRFRLFEESGMPVAMVTVATDGWLAAVEAGLAEIPAQDGDAVCLDMDYQGTELLVVRRGVPLFSRNMAIGTRECAANPEAGEGRLVQESVRALETYRNEHPAATLGAVVLGGAAGRLLETVGARLKTALRVETVASDTLEHLCGGQESPGVRAVSLAGVVGAAAAPDRLQVNLMPESVAMRKAVLAKARNLTIGGILVMAILGLVSLAFISRLQARQMYVDELGRRIAATTSEADRIEGMKRKVAIVVDRTAARMVPVRALVELHAVTGEETSFTAIEINDAAQVVCRGTTETVADTVKLVRAMEESPVFRNVKSTRTATGKDRTTEFEVIGEIEKGVP